MHVTVSVTCCGVQCSWVESGQSERLLGAVEGGAGHHDLGHPRLPRTLDHLVQVAGELLVGQVGPDVDNDVVGELVHHGGGGGPGGGAGVPQLLLGQLGLRLYDTSSHS